MPNYFTCKCRLCNCRASVACTIWSNYNYGHNFVIHLICWVLEGRHLLLPSFLSRFFWPKKLYKHHGQYIILFLSNCSSSAHAAALIFPCFIFFKIGKKLKLGILWFFWKILFFIHLEFFENFDFFNFWKNWKLFWKKLKKNGENFQNYPKTTQIVPIPSWDINFSRRDRSAFSGSPFNDPTLKSIKSKWKCVLSRFLWGNITFLYKENVKGMFK